VSFGVGVIGCGIRGQHSYEMALADHPACHVAAICQYPDITPEMLEGKDPQAHGRQYARRLDARWCHSVAELLGREDVQIVSLMCEPHAAPGLVEACCAAGKHIVRDKPMCLDLPGADRIVAAVDAAGVQMLLTLWQRFSPPIRAVCEAVSRGQVGKVMAAHFTWLWPGGPLEGFTATEGYLHAVGGGELTNFGHYCLDTLLWVVGQPVVEVCAHTHSLYYPDYQTIGMEDMARVKIAFADGAEATVITGRTPLRARPEHHFHLEITGTHGTVACTSQEGGLLLCNGNCSPAPTGPPAVQAMVSEFIGALDRGEASPITARDGREVLRVLEMAYDSARAEGKAVRREEELQHG
jgi:predicted dehydrogenase